MSMKQVICLLALGAFTTLASATEAHACAKDHADIADVEHAAEAAHDHSLKVDASLGVDAPAAAPASVAKGRKHTAAKGAAAEAPKSMLPTRAAVAALQDEEEGGCIHANGCDCRGRTSHRRTCGTQGDCHAHPGLVCTWGGMIFQ